MTLDQDPEKRAAYASWFPWVLYALALLLTAFLVKIGGHSFWDSYLRALLLFNVGFQGLWAAAAHLTDPERTAAAIGWPSCGFQTEIGFANLALGITGVLSFFNLGWLTPVALIAAILYAGCAYIHIQDRLENKNAAPCNSGPMLYCTILVATSLFLAILVR